ncbi:MAG: hypothetical protein V4650_01835 [Pseudomonadota bacterium]
MNADIKKSISPKVLARSGLRSYRLISVLAPALFVTACGGGGGEGSQAAQKTFSALGEARRMAVLYRPLRDVSAALLPYARPSADLVALDGKTTPCLNGGSATTTYSPGPGNGNIQTLQVQFTNCAESVGLVTGSLTLAWNSSDDNTSAQTFIPTWFGSFAVDGVNYNIERPSLISLSYNTNSGYRRIEINVKSLSGMTGPSGPGLQLKQQQWSLIDDPTVSSYQINDAFSNISNSNGAIGTWRSPASIQIPRMPASAAFGGVGVPSLGGFAYFRTLRSGMLESISGDQSSQSGLLNVTVAGSSTKLSDAGQFSWSTLLSTALYDMDGQ